MTNDQVLEAFNKWVKDVTGWTTINAYQSGDRPTMPYIMVNLTGTVEVRDNAMDVEFTPDREDEAPPVGDVFPPITAAPVIEMEWRFSVHAFGGGHPTDLLRPLTSAAQLPQVLEGLGTGLHVHELSQIRNVPEWVNNDWEPRAQVDIFLRGLTRDGFVIDVIDDIEPFNVTRQGS